MTASWIPCGTKQAKLLRGQALPDMSGLVGKVAENCGNSSLETV
jgi:hypothetical protein